MADFCNHCNDYARSEVLRAAIAEAGRGLPVIEPGMPLPAGTGLTRRSFVARSAGMLLAVYGASKLPLRAFEDGIAQAAIDAPNAPVLVTIFLSGGADALNVLFPAGDPLYAQLRPNIKLDPSGAKQVAEDGRLYWHPSLGGLSQLYGEGKVTLLPSVGYTHPDQSHFTSRHFWEVGATDASLMTGWMGRFLDAVGAPDNPLQGLALDTRLAPALASAKVPVSAIDATDKYTFAASGVGDVAVTNRMIETIAALALPADPSEPALVQATAAVKQSAELRAQLATFNTDGASFRAGVGFLIGSRTPGRMIGQYAGLQSGLDSQGNLVPTADFRGVYASLLEQWFGQDASQVIPDASTFARVQVVK